MLRIYPLLLDLVRSVSPLIDALERRDPDLARQCRRALSSAPLNLAEGSYSQGRNRRARYFNALGSLREALACLETAAAFGYLPPINAPLRAEFDRILGTLVMLVR
ncbi:MAG: four helix bundle protein [Polyangiaceae bacterium]